jgi:hypothetical protein
MTTKNSALSGKEALSLLEMEASSEIKKARQIIEEAVDSDIRAYLGSMGFKNLHQQNISGLVTAAVAGGQWGFNSLVNRLSSLDLEIKNLNKAANEILTLIYRHGSILNYARIRVTSVQSIVKTLVGKSTSIDSKKNLSEVLDFKINSRSTLLKWAELAEQCYQDLVTYTGRVSTRSISTYSKLWKSYVEEKLSSKLGFTESSNKQDYISERLKPIVAYKSPTPAQIEKLIANSAKKYTFDAQPKVGNKNRALSKLVTEKKDLGGRSLLISYNMDGIDPELIQPVINSIKGQLIINPKQDKILVDMSSESSQVIIEIEKPKKDDLDTIRIQLGALATLP